jgi:hypothetical protein
MLQVEYGWMNEGWMNEGWIGEAILLEGEYTDVGELFVHFSKNLQYVKLNAESTSNLIRTSLFACFSACAWLRLI